MTAEAHAASAAQAPASPKEVPKKKGFWRGLVQRFVDAYGVVAFVFAWCFPPVLYAVGYSMGPVLDFLSATFPAIPNNQWVGYLAVVILGGIGILIQGAMANNEKVPIRHLIMDNDVSGTWVAITWAVAGAAIWTGHYDFWLWAPAVYTLVELYNGSNIGFRNAYVRTPVDFKSQK